MYLTGFDSKPLNTLYVDKWLKYHDLLQAFSRTNRVEEQTKVILGILFVIEILKKEQTRRYVYFQKQTA